MANIQKELLTKLEENYPFLTYIKWKERSTIGIVQNIDNKILMLYDFTRIISPESKKQFLNYGEKWWYESNTEQPIEIYIGESFDVFSHILIGYPVCDIIEFVGPSLKLDEKLTRRRIKRRRTELVREI